MKESASRCLHFLRLPAAAAFLTLGLTLSAQASASDSKTRVLASVGNTKITEGEVDEKARPQLTAIDNQVYLVKKKAIDDLIDDYLIDKAAKKAGLSKEAYLTHEVEDKAPAPSSKEVEAFYKENQARINQPLNAIAPQLGAYMRRQKLQAQRAELVARLRHDANVKVMLKAPRVAVATQDSAGSLGPSNARVTMVEFSDFQCPYCKRSESAVKEVLKKYGDKVRLIYMDYPLPMHSNAMKAAEAARCAADQGKFWEYHDALFADQSKLEPDALKATAARLKLDAAKFNQCLDHDVHALQVRKSQEDGNAAGVDGTPSFVINGRMLTGAQPASDMESVIDEELSQQNLKEASAH